MLHYKYIANSYSNKAYLFIYSFINFYNNNNQCLMIKAWLISCLWNMQWCKRTYLITDVNVSCLMHTHRWMHYTCVTCSPDSSAHHFCPSWRNASIQNNQSHRRKPASLFPGGDADRYSLNSSNISSAIIPIQTTRRLFRSYCVALASSR